MITEIDLTSNRMHEMLFEVFLLWLESSAERGGDSAFIALGRQLNNSSFVVLNKPRTITLFCNWVNSDFGLDTLL